MKNCLNKEHKTVLINSNDLIVKLIDKHRAELELYFTIAATTVPGNVEKYDNKSTMSKLAEDIGFNVPQTMICKWDTDISNLNYYGLFNVQYGMLGDKAYFFEANLRNDGISHFFYQASANIPLAWVLSSLIHDYLHIPTVVDGDHYYMDEIYDIQNVKEGKVFKVQWEKECVEAIEFKYYDKDDIAPCKAMKRVKAKELLMGSLVAKYRIYIVYILDKLGIKRR